LCVVCPDVEIVIVHDAVRPLVGEECITAVVSAAYEHGVSITFCVDSSACHYLRCISLSM